MVEKAKDVYCGIDTLKKNQKRGTAKECSKLKQIRYYGLNKVPKNVADEYKGIPVESKLREKRIAKSIGSLRGQIDRYKEDIKDYKEEDDYKKNKHHQKAVKELEEKLSVAREKLKKVLEKMKEFDIRAKKPTK
jgi:hypothetical protein